MNKCIKLAGIATCAVVLGLSVFNALNDYGIKGNKNLLPDILANGSSASSSSSGSCTGSITPLIHCLPENVEVFEPTVSAGYEYYWCEFKVGLYCCHKRSWSEKTCSSGSKQCNYEYNVTLDYICNSFKFY